MAVNYLVACAAVGLVSANVSAQTVQSPMDLNELTHIDVSLDTGTGTLDGTILRPSIAGTTPVVLLIAGSGPTDRDGNSSMLSGKNDSLLLLARALASLGIASLRYDKRGIGKSRGAMRDESSLLFDHYVDDAASWVKQLKADPRFSTVTIIGHSEGSLIGMLAATKSEANAFVSISGPARRGSEILHEQLLPKLPPELAKKNEVILSALENSEQVDAIPPSLISLYRPSVQPYLISWFRYTPGEVFKKLTIPSLIIQGTTDIQVRTDEAVSLKNAQPNAKLKIIEGMNHVLKMVPIGNGAQLSSYADPSLPVSSELVAELVQFVGALK